jgi:hypothetical protein
MSAFSSNSDSKGGGWHRRAWSWVKERLNSEDHDRRSDSRPHNGEDGVYQDSRRAVPVGGVSRNMRFEVCLESATMNIVAVQMRSFYCSEYRLIVCHKLLRVPTIGCVEWRSLTVSAEQRVLMLMASSRPAHLFLPTSSSSSFFSTVLHRSHSPPVTP